MVVGTGEEVGGMGGTEWVGVRSCVRVCACVRACVRVETVGDELAH